jgi:DNA-binding NarL/FixJ family response regulator
LSLVASPPNPEEFPRPLLPAKETLLSREPNQLTTRQLEVLRLLASGRSTAEIAAELGLSTTTVRNYIANMLVALGVHSRLQAVIAAREAGLIDP